MVRSRAQYTDQGKKPTKYFCALEKHNYVSKIITNLELNNGIKVNNQEDILKETKSFYENLYKSRDDTFENIELDNYMNHIEMPILSNETANNIEGF